LYMNVIEGVLYIYHNDGGLSSDDKLAIVHKYKSATNPNTTSLNGIGIRRAIDKICERYENERDPVSLSYISETMRECIRFYFCVDPAWKYGNWVPMLADEELSKYNEACSTMELAENTPGTLWKIPLNQEYKEVFEDKDTIVPMLKRFFNRKLDRSAIKINYQGDNVIVGTPLCTDTCPTLTFTLYEKGDRRKSRFLRLHNSEGYNNTPYRFIPETMNISDNTVFNQVDIPSDSTEVERFTIRMKLYEKQAFETMEKEYAIHGRKKLKGVWVYVTNSCILNEGIMRHNGQGKTNYFDKDYCPIIEIDVDRNTSLFNLSGMKSKTRETQVGEKLLKLAWSIFKHSHINDPNQPALPDQPDQPAQPAQPDQPDEPVGNSNSSTPKDRSQIPHDVHREIWKRRFGDNVGIEGTCICCQNTIDAITRGHEIGHIEPVSRGGTNEWNNIIPICKTCNSNMADKHMDEWMKEKYGNEYERYMKDMEEYLGTGGV